MTKISGIAHYLDETREKIVIAALRAYGDRAGLPTDAERKTAVELADALENDTYLLESTTPPDPENADKIDYSAPTPAEGAATAHERELAITAAAFVRDGVVLLEQLHDSSDPVFERPGVASFRFCTYPEGSYKVTVEKISDGDLTSRGNGQ
jgi:hypothetical protein